MGCAFLLLTLFGVVTLSMVGGLVNWFIIFLVLWLISSILGVLVTRILREVSKK